MRRGRQHRDEVGLGVVLVIPENPGPDPLAGKRKRDHDDPPSFAEAMEGRAAGRCRWKFQVTSSKAQGFSQLDAAQARHLGW